MKLLEHVLARAPNMALKIIDAENIHGRFPGHDGVYTRNVVYREVL